MKIIDKCNSYKEKYPKYVVIIKAGNFYEVLNDDAKIINHLFNYKINKTDNYIKVGFPIIALNKVTTKLDKEKINYLIVASAVTKKRFNKNNYDNVLIKYSHNDERIKRIIRIIKNDNISNNIIDKIEELL